MAIQLITVRAEIRETMGYVSKALTAYQTYGHMHSMLYAKIMACKPRSS